MQPDQVVVLSYGCSAKAQKIADELEKAFKALQRNVQVRCDEAGAVAYWDGTARAMVAACPLGYSTRTPVVAAPMAYTFPTPENIRLLAQQLIEIFASEVHPA